MAIIVNCQNCRTTAEVPDSAAGSREKCRSCGAIIAVPGVVVKRCKQCGTDVARRKRWKDAGEYFCDPCWLVRRGVVVAEEEPDNFLDALESLESSGRLAADDEAPRMPCERCGTIVPIYQLKRVADRHFCLNCYSNFELAQQPALSHAQPRPTNKELASAPKQKFFTVPGLILLGLVIAGGIAALVMESQGSGGRAARYDSTDERSARVDEHRTEQGEAAVPDAPSAASKIAAGSDTLAANTKVDATVGSDVGADQPPLSAGQPAVELQSLILEYCKLRLAGDAKMAEARTKLRESERLAASGRLEDASTASAASNAALEEAKLSLRRQAELASAIEQHPREEVYAVRDRLLASSNTSETYKPVLRLISIQTPEKDIEIRKIAGLLSELAVAIDATDADATSRVSALIAEVGDCDPALVLKGIDAALQMPQISGSARALFAKLRIAVVAAQAKIAETARATQLHEGRALLIFAKDQQKEAEIAQSACKRFGLQYVLANSFDSSRTDYNGIQTIIAGSNTMMYWKDANANPEAFRPIDDFIRGGGHLLVFGSWNGDGMKPLTQYGITSGGQHSWYFDEEPGNTSLLFQGQEQLVPSDRRLRSTANLSCSGKCSVLLKRAMRPGGGDPGSLPGGPVALTLLVGQGRLTVTSVEPFFTEAPETREAYWLIPCLISWVARGSPTVEGGATVVPHTPAPPADALQTAAPDTSPKADESRWTDTAVEEARGRMLSRLDAFLSDARERVLKLPYGSDAKKALADSIRAKDAERKAIAAASVGEVRDMLRDQEAKRQQKREAATAAREEQKREMEAIRQEKFPGWNGPWKVCPICHGTGRDEIAQREENDREASIALSQAAGTSGGHTWRPVEIKCKYCGGLKEVPDR